MSTIENETIVRRYMEEGVSRGNVAIADEVLAAGFVFHFPGVPVPMDVNGWKGTTALFHTAFPDQTTTVDALIAEGDQVAARFTFRGTHQGDFQGLAPTGKTATMTGIAFWRLAEGKIAEHWVEIDAMGLMQQLGAIPAPAGA